jgi:hypothetical protein
MIMTLQAGDKLMSLTDVSEMLGIPVHTLVSLAVHWRWSGRAATNHRRSQQTRDHPLPSATSPAKSTPTCRTTTAALPLAAIQQAA